MSWIVIYRTLNVRYRILNLYNIYENIAVYVIFDYTLVYSK